MSQYTTRAAEKLRLQKSICGAIYTFIQTNQHKLHEKQYSIGRTITLPEPTSYTPELIKEALYILRKIYKRGYKYIKAGVYLSEIIPDDYLQLNMYKNTNHERHKSVMKAVDGLNYVWGRGTVNFASSGIEQVWKMNMNFRSNRYTTNWNELLTIRV